VSAELPPLEVAGRAARLRQLLAEGHDGLRALIVSDLSDIRWLCGFTGSNGWAVLTPDGVVLVTDGRYGDQGAAQLAAAGVDGSVRVGRTGAALLDELAAVVDPFGQVGFDDADVSVAQHRRWTERLAAALVPAAGVVESGRRVKDAGEIARMRRACEIADQALIEAAPMLADRPSEADVRNRLEARMRELGASGPSYDTIVATGPLNAPRPHHRPTDTVIEAGHTVIIDVGALFDGYHSDMTRTFVVGEPTAVQAEAYEVVRLAQRAGVEAVRAGLPARDLDAACRDVIAAAGWGDWFVHGTSHGVGLDIHEDPFSNTASTDVLVAGDVVTVEPGLYRGDFGGVRIEDLVVVGHDGAQVLTGTPIAATPGLSLNR
jgi:Xaa-Pro aminopeptidase